jgi:methylated-DNA-[protein]-cysteine S-methyltransferase
MYYTMTQSPLGYLVLTANDDGLTGLYTPEHRRYKSAQMGEQGNGPFAETIQQLKEYFAGLRNVFDIRLAPQGTTFQQQVWNQLQKIPYGETRGYGQLAAALNKNGAARAVGLANGRNPISIIVPCHRVVGANGTLTGYAGGLAAKEWLLNHEKHIG